MWKRTVGAVGAIVLGAILTFGAVAFAEVLSWTPATTSTGGTAYTSSEMATMTFYVRIDKSNPKDTAGVSGWYYLGEARSGGLSFPADNSLASLMRSYGLGGQTVQFTVSQAFKDTDGKEYDSAQSAAYSWVIPVPFSPRLPGAPSGVGIR
jgi:hypothetical protein